MYYYYIILYLYIYLAKKELFYKIRERDWGLVNLEISVYEGEGLLVDEHQDGYHVNGPSRLSDQQLGSFGERYGYGTRIIKEV